MAVCLFGGENSTHQLGAGSMKYQLTPLDITKRIPLSSGDKIIGIDTDGRSMLAWTANGGLYVWGDNSDGRLGVSDEVADHPIRLSVVSNVELAQLGKSIYVSTINKEIKKIEVAIGGVIASDITRELTHPSYLLDIGGVHLNKVKHVWADFNNNGNEDDGESMSSYQSYSSDRLLIQLPTRMAKPGSYDVHIRTATSPDIVIPNGIKISLNTSADAIGTMRFKPEPKLIRSDVGLPSSTKINGGHNDSETITSDSGAERKDIRAGVDVLDERKASNQADIEKAGQDECAPNSNQESSVNETNGTNKNINNRLATGHNDDKAETLGDSTTNCTENADLVVCEDLRVSKDNATKTPDSGQELEGNNVIKDGNDSQKENGCRCYNDLLTKDESGETVESTGGSTREPPCDKVRQWRSEKSAQSAVRR